MSAIKETRTIFLALITTLGLIGVCFWGIIQMQGSSKPPVSSFDQDLSPNSQLPTQPTPSPSSSQTFAQVSDVPRGRFNYGGGTSWNLLRESVDPIIQSVWPQFRLRYTLPPSKSLNSTTGIEMLLDNQLAFALSSRSLKQDEFVPPYQQPLVPPENCPEKRNQLNQDAFETGEDPITKRLFVIVKQNDQVDQKAGEAYANLLLTLQGQDLLEQAGYTRIIY